MSSSAISCHVTRKKTIAAISHGLDQRWNSVLRQWMNVLKTASVLRPEINCFRDSGTVQKSFHYNS